MYVSIHDAVCVAGQVPRTCVTHCATFTSLSHRSRAQDMSSVPFHEALGTLENMFPELDSSVIRSVLDAREGHMEQTVEALLQMSRAKRASGGGSSSVGNGRGYGGQGSTSYAQDEAIARGLQSSYHQQEEVPRMTMDSSSSYRGGSRCAVG